MIDVLVMAWEIKLSIRASRAVTDSTSARAIKQSSPVMPRSVMRTKLTSADQLETAASGFSLVYYCTFRVVVSDGKPRRPAHYRDWFEDTFGHNGLFPVGSTTDPASDCPFRGV